MPIPTPPPAFVVALVQRSTRFLGDPRPASAAYYLTRRETAVEASSGASVNSDRASYLVVLTGSFHGGEVGPAGAGQRLAGTVASYVIDAASGRETDFSLGSQQAVPMKLGRGGNLLPYLAGARTPACGAPDLRASAWFQGATGSELGGLTITNDSGVACTLPARPPLSLIANGRKLAVRELAPAQSGVQALLPRRRVRTILQWWNWCGTPRGRALRVTVELRLQPVPLRARVTGRVTAPYCNGPASTLRVTPFAPAP